MKSGELATILQVTSETVRQWINHPLFVPFFSPGAKAEHGGVHRVFSQNDVLILNTIRHLRTNGVTDWQEIANRLASGERFEQFPQNAISGDPRTVPMAQAEVSVRAAATMAERDFLASQVGDLQNRVASLEKQLELERTSHKQDLERLLREMGQLQRELGAASAKLEGSKGQGG